MFRRSLAQAFLLSLSLLVGCVVVETPPNANAPTPGASVAENRPGTSPSPTPGGGPAASGSPGSDGGAVSDAPAGSKLETYMRAAASELAPEQREALGRIAGDSRRLLALRGYLRAGAGAASRWAWPRERVEAYEKSAEHAAALAEIEKVRREFEAANPGHTLRVNTQVRSLDEQLEKWNETDSVGRAGDELLGRAREELAANAYGEEASAADVRKFVSFLRGSPTRAAPTVAVPGLSPHGQSRAFDFQVMRGTQLVAGPSAASEWDRAGWSAKLQEAVRRSGAKFSGPLASPREPWHYDYRP